MTDARLNTVVDQYFGDQAVSATAAASQVLPEASPGTVSRTTIDSFVQTNVIASGLLNQFDAASTVFNFLLPRGIILTTDVAAQEAGIATDTVPASASDDFSSGNDGGLNGGPTDVSASSLSGLGGYHGSVKSGAIVVYFAVGVYSEIQADGTQNGIVAFAQPWKNIVAAFYHELQEVRTDADVEEAIRTQNLSLIGWNSDQGEEIGDFPVFEANPLQQVFVEVPLLTGGIVPVQLLYSNRVQGPENPTL